MVVRFLLILTIVFCAIHSKLLSQTDTLTFLIRQSKIEDNFHFGEYKMILLLDGGKKERKETAIRKLIGDLCYKSKSNSIYIKVYKSKGYLISSGYWNENGFIGPVIFYKKNGQIKSIINFEKN